ncbi:basic proline-rich protein-like [Budorcas taxicolor]|uniref:basic proline-rich protein-like n=1 Tax=Budorcas taxicolor TaxID=37181 RepID=UPI0022846407|nr:basic proline-rich protein-like [Budorcas taxicolor]
MRPAAPGRRPGGVLFNFPLRYLLTIGLVPVFSLRWSLPPALGCIPKQPDSGKTRARRAGGRYRPHTVHGLGLDQKDLGPPRAAPGSGSSRVATSDLRSRLGGRARARTHARGAREPARRVPRRGGAEARGRPPRAPPLPAHTRHPDRPTDPRLPVAPPGGGGGGGGRRPAAGGRRGRGRGGAGSTSRLPRNGRGAGRRRGGRGREGRGTRGRRSPSGRRTRRAPPIFPPPPPPPPPSRRELRGANRGAATARGESAQRRADAAASRGSPPRHASPGRGRARGLGLGREPPVPTGRGPRGVWPGSGHGPRTHGAGEAAAGVGVGGAPAGRRDTPPPRAGRRTTADRKTRPHPRHHRGPPPPRGARPSPTPDTPRAATPKGRLRRDEALPGTREGRAHAPHTATGHATTAGQPPPDGRGGSDRGAPRRAPPRPLGGRRSPGETGGTWKGEGGRGAQRAPTGHRPDADHRPPTTAPPPEAARGPRRCRPVTHGGPPPRAGRPPPGGPRRAPDSQPHRPPPERGRALSPPQRPHTLPPPAPQPRGPEGAGRRPATAGQAQSGGTTDDDRPRRTGPGPAAREATGQGERPHDGESRRPSRRTARETRPEDPRRAGSTGRGGGEAVVAGATGDSQVRPSSQRSARAVGRPRRGRSEGLTKPSNRAGRRRPGGEDAATGPRGGRDRGPPSRARASAPGRGAPPRPARDGGGGGGDDTGDGSGPRRAREARHTGARPRGAADGEGTEAGGRTERGTDGMRPRGADTTRPAAEVGWPRATARGTAQSDPGEGTRVGRRGPPRDLTATGPPGTGAVPRHHPGTTAWRPHPRGAHAHRHPRSRSRPGENTLPPHTGAPPPPTALTRAGPPAPPPSLRAPRALLRPGTPPARQRPGDDTHVRRGEAGSGPDRGPERGRSHARDEERRGRRRRRGGAGKHARRGPRDRDAGAVRGPEERDRARGRAPRNTSAGSHRHPHARAVPRRPGRRPAPAIPGAWPTTRPRRQGRRAVHPSSAIHPRQVRLPSESRGATPRAQRSRARRPGP